jgi:hypothetical protein
MHELSHYRLWKRFTLRQAAYLAAGADPAAVQAHDAGESILASLNEAASEALGELRHRGVRDNTLPPEALRPILLDPDSPEMPSITLTPEWVNTIEARFLDPSHTLAFAPEELDRWFNANGRGFVSKFDFGSLAADGPQVTTEDRAEKGVSSRERTTYLNIIGALLELVLTPRAGRESQAAVVSEVVQNYGEKQGIAKSTLEQKFAKAKRTLLEAARRPPSAYRRAAWSALVNAAATCSPKAQTLAECLRCGGLIR